MADDFLSNRKEDLQQLGYLLKHKAKVYKAGRQLGVPKVQLALHDARKLLPKEWVPYREYFHDKPNKTDIKNFVKAVEHHKKNNPHHHYLSAPRNVKLEAVADWYSAGSPKKVSFKKWIKQNMNKFPKEVQQELVPKIAALKIPSQVGTVVDAIKKYKNPLITGAVVAPAALNLATTIVEALKKGRVLKRKGLYGGVQRWAKARKSGVVGDFVYRNPEAATIGGTAALGMLGAELLGE